MKQFSTPSIIAVFATLLITVSVAVYIYLYPSPRAAPIDNTEPDQIITKDTSGCLEKDEYAEYELTDKKRAEDSAVIVVKDKTTGNEQRRFIIPLSSATHYHPLELHKCAVYAIRRFNYDFTKSGRNAFLSNYKKELWHYGYNVSAEKVLLLSELGPHGDLNFPFYQDDFRISPDERYLVLEKGFAGSSNGVYDIVFKDLETLEDVFVLPVTEVWENYPDTVPGSSVGFDQGWTKDGRYFWVNFFGGAPVFAYLRIDSTDWSYDVYMAPPDVLGGDQLNIETSWLTVHPKNVWIGVSEWTEEERARRRAEGIGTELYIYNLFTQERRLVETTDEPLYYFRPQWISDTELEYTMPNGERRTYMIN